MLLSYDLQEIERTWSNPRESTMRWSHQPSTTPADLLTQDRGVYSEHQTSLPELLTSILLFLFWGESTVPVPQYFLG